MKQIEQSSFPTVVTIGNFDGLHLGHLKLIEKTKSLANKKRLKSLVCSFDCNTKGAQLIYPQNQLKTSLRMLKVDYYVSLPFFRKIMHLTCEEFVQEYLVNRLQARYVVVGEDFCFGKNRSGNVETLAELGKQFGFQVIVAKMYTVGKQFLSSTYIRSLLQAGNIKRANRYLYQPFSINGTVIKGYSAGKNLLQCPTANISIPKRCISLPFGVYLTETIVEKTVYKSITNIGYAPTYPKTKPVIETYLLDFNGDLYGKKVQIRFFHFLRKERKFSSMEALKNQIAKDVSRRLS